MARVIMLVISMCLALLILTSNASRTGSQQAIPNKLSEAIKPVSKTIKADGWMIPKASYMPSDHKSSILLDGVYVDLRKLKPHKPIVDFDEFYVYSKDELKIFSDKRKIVLMAEYSRNNKKFAYWIRYSPYLGVDADVAGVIEKYFVDRDGDGIFEERNSKEISVIPEWIKISTK